ncbi:hypothetical protein JTY78_22335, partial [Citrobacter freundii]|nr:hypothetical protein [Citrobacter freundii]
IERFIDRFSRIYTPAIMAVALLVTLVPPLLFAASWQEWIYKGSPFRPRKRWGYIGCGRHP